MKKKAVTAALLAGVMLTLSLTGCGGGSGTGNSAEDSEDDHTMRVAMITDSGDITDQCFNQTTYETCKAWSTGNGVEFKYYKPENDSDISREASVDQAVADGANVVVLPGYIFAAAVVDESPLYPDVKFIALDVGKGDICEKGVRQGYTYNPDDYEVSDYYNTDNVYCCTYREELSGYMAGYAAVKLGYRHLGFLGGMSVPAVTRFGYGYVQGADAAAVELGIADQVTVEYIVGGQFYGDADITAAMDTWYKEKGVEVVFACGGGIYTSVVEAAEKENGKIIGVDSDQSGIIGEELTVTSAMKGLGATINTVLDAIYAGEWDDYVGKIDNLGIDSENPEENYVQLPWDTTQWSDGFTQDDYKELVKKLYHGEIEVSSDVSQMPKTTITVKDQGSIK